VTDTIINFGRVNFTGGDLYGRLIVAKVINTSNIQSYIKFDISCVF